MTNPFANPFHPGNSGNGPTPPPATPAPPVPGPSEPNRPGIVAKVIGWAILVFGVLGVLASFGSWSDPFMAVGLLLFGAAFIVVGATMIWRRWSWKIGGPATAALFVLSIVLSSFGNSTEESPKPATLLDTPSSSTTMSTTTTTATSTVVSSTTVTVTAERSSEQPTSTRATRERDVDVDTPAPRRTTPAYTPPPVTQEDNSGGSAYYANCDAVRAAGKAPLHAGEPGYRSKLDRDGDGVACDGG